MQTTDLSAAAPRPAKILSTATRVRAGVDGQLTAECRPCRLHLDQLPGTDVERALRTFDAAHGDGPHTHALPWGWRTAARA
jgi:hypothetical protein